MDISTQCLSVFKSFINDIIKVFPEYDLKLQDIYGPILSMDTCKLEEQELLTEFMDRVHKLNKKITNKDESMFNDDPLLLTDISFKNIWTTNISYKTKETIWKYLQTFCLLSLNHQSNKALATALADLSDNKDIDLLDKNIASDVKKIKRMTENIQEPIAEDLTDTSVVVSDQPAEPVMQNPLEAIMGNSDIGRLAEEVSKELDLESMLGSLDSDNPMEMFQNLMNGDAMNKIMGTIHDVVNTKVNSGELNKEDMMSEAQGIYGQLGQTDMFQKMAQQAQQTQAQQQQQQPQQQAQQQAEQPAQQNNPHSSNKTKVRLQKKLKEKQKVQVNKVDN